MSKPSAVAARPGLYREIALDVGTNRAGISPSLTGYGPSHPVLVTVMVTRPRPLSREMRGQSGWHGCSRAAEGLMGPAVGAQVSADIRASPGLPVRCQDGTEQADLHTRLPGSATKWPAPGPGR